MAGYKKDQGRMARMAAFWTLAVLIFFGCSSLRSQLAGKWKASLGESLSSSFEQIPILGVKVTPALLISGVLFGGLMFLMWRWQEKPKTADMLIETEAELRKVTWPGIDEVITSSTVVVVCVMILMAFLAGADWFLARVTQVLLFG